MLKRKRSQTAALTVALTTALFAAATPAVAEPSTASAGECSFPDTLCLFEGENFTGEQFAVFSLEPGGTCVSLVDHGWGGRASSAINTHDSSAALFMNDDCVGGPYQVPGSSSVSSFGTFEALSVWIPG